MKIEFELCGLRKKHIPLTKLHSWWNSVIHEHLKGYLYILNDRPKGTFCSRPKQPKNYWFLAGERIKKSSEWRLKILSLFLEGKLEGTTRLLSLLRLVKIIKVSNSIYFYLIYVASSNYHRWFASWNLAEIHHQILRKNYHYAHCHHVTYFCFILASYWKQINYVSTSKWK